MTSEPRRRQAALGLVVLLLGLFTVFQSYTSDQRDKDQQDCIEEKFAELSNALEVRSEVTKRITKLEDRKSDLTTDVMLAFSDAAEHPEADNQQELISALLKYKKDDREPFPAVYALFEGKTTPEAILAGIAAAKIGDEARESRLFYAELYIGLNLSVEGKDAEALPHLKKAAANRWAPEAGYGPAYMWHVGRLHAEKLGK